MDEQKANTVRNNFDLLWQILDERYCFFDEKGIDWNAIYHEYNYNLDMYCDSDPVSQCLFDTMNQMLQKLCDGHVVLNDGTVVSSYTGWYDPYPANFDGGRIFASIGPVSRTLNNETFFSSLPGTFIGYIRCGSFSEKFNRHDLDNALAQFDGFKGVIIDVRGNGGGLVSEAYMLASRFARTRTHVGYVRYKTGKAHDDFSKFFARHVNPDGAYPFHGNVVVLTNRRVYSAANLFVSIMGNLPQVCVMGDCTGGGGGVPISAELYNGWTVELSTNPVFDTRQRSIESGIDPDLFVKLDSKNDQPDNIIKTAKEWILANQVNQD